MAVEGAAPAEVVAGYRIEQRIGRGGMGDVYRALDVSLGRPVALKLLRPELRADERFRERLLRESRLAAALDHPNVVPIYEAGEADGRLFIAMRYVDGADLRTLLRRESRLEPARAIAMATQVADALDAAHERGLVHRDVKPSNVLVARTGSREHCYLADFGLTQSASDTGPTDGQFMGTVDYVAPEQIRGDELDGRADQYALGCLLFELLTGTLPFALGSDVAVVFAHLQEPPPRASARNTRLPATLDDVVQRALAKDPAERFASCRAFVDAAAAALGIAAPALRRRRGAALSATLAAAAALTAIVLALVLRSGGASAPTGGLVHIDARTGHASSAASIAGFPGSVAAADDAVWVADFRSDALWRYTPRTGSVEPVPTSGEPRQLAVLGGKVYVAADGPRPLTGTVVRYDAATGIREDGRTLLACAITAGDGVVWAAGCPFVNRLSTDGGPLRETRKVFVPYASPLTALDIRSQFRALAVGGRRLWVLGDALDPRLWRLDRHSGAIEGWTRLGFPPRSLVYSRGLVWLTDPLDDLVVAVDAGTLRVAARIRVCRGAAGIAANGGGIWVACSLQQAVDRIDPATHRVMQTIPVSGSPVELAVHGSDVWVTTDAA